jgi:anthranilate phosphoribosyltransferase
MLALIKTLSRGARRPLGEDCFTEEEAFAFMQGILAGELTPLQLGASLMALRIKSETTAELQGFLRAAQATLRRIPSFDQPVVLMPCYNGARKLPSLALLLAAVLAQTGVPVLLHGMRRFPGRVTTYEVCQAFEALTEQTVIASSMGEAIALLAQHNLCFVPTDVLSEPLDAALSLREEMGLRSSVHTLVKMLQPLASPTLNLIPITHGEYREAMQAFYLGKPQQALLFRGAEGEPVPPTVRPTEVFGLGGLPNSRCDVSDDALPEIDAASTAAWIQRVLAGELVCPLAIGQMQQLLQQPC